MKPAANAAKPWVETMKPAHADGITKGDAGVADRLENVGGDKNIKCRAGQGPGLQFKAVAEQVGDDDNTEHRQEDIGENSKKSDHD